MRVPGGNLKTVRLDLSTSLLHERKTTNTAVKTSFQQEMITPTYPARCPYFLGDHVIGLALRAVPQPACLKSVFIHLFISPLAIPVKLVLHPCNNNFL